MGNRRNDGRRSVFMAELSDRQIDRLGDLMRGHRDWSDETFGDVGPVGSLKHLAEEAQEAASAPCDATEYADCMFLMWDALARQEAFTVDELLDAMEAKMAINRARIWPGPMDGQPRNHTRDAGD